MGLCVKLGTFLVVVISLAACGGDDDDDGLGGQDAGIGDPVDAGVCGELAPPSAPWLDDQLAETVAVLSGAAEIAPDVTVTDRASDVHREAVRDYLSAQLEALGLDAELQSYAGGANVFATVEGEGAGGALVV